MLDSSSIVAWHSSFAKNPIQKNVLPFDEYMFEPKGNFLERVSFKKDKDVLNLPGIDKDAYLNPKVSTIIAE